MVRMAKEPKHKVADKKKRNTIFITLDDDTEVRLQRFLNSQRVKPDRAAETGSGAGGMRRGASRNRKNAGGKDAAA